MSKLKLTSTLILRLAALAILITVTAGVTLLALAADCGNGLPCGPVPWNLPALPRLESPTPIPTIHITAVPTSTPVTATSTPEDSGNSLPFCLGGFGFQPTCTPMPELLDGTTASDKATEIADMLATVGALANSTPIAIDVNGTQVSVYDFIATAQPGIEDLFGRVKGILGADWGPFSPMMIAALLGFGIVFFVIAITYIAPIFGFVFGIVRKIYTAIMDFLPL